MKKLPGLWQVCVYGLYVFLHAFSHFAIGRIRDESSVHASKIKEVDTRIESEIAGVRTSIQSAKFNVLQYLVGVATGAGALLLAYLRMFR